jgi:uncharacterized membrane protein
MLVVALYLSWRSTRRVPKRIHRWLLLSLRLTGAITLWLLIAGPAIELRHIQKIRNYLPIFIDTSASMRVRSDAREPSRFEQLKAFFQRNQAMLSQLREEHQVRFYHFNRAIQPFDGLLEHLQPDGDQTDLLRIGQFLHERYADRPLSGVIIATDGIDTLAQQQTQAVVQAPSGDSGQTRANAAMSSSQTYARRRLQDLTLMLKQLQIPVHIIAPPPATQLRDIAVTEIHGDSFAFLYKEATIEVRIRAIGYANVQIPVNFYLEDNLLQTKVIKLKTDSEEQVVIFEFKPHRAGHFIYSVRVPPVEGESILENNRRDFILKIIRDRIRVLHIVGRPTWDVRFLRRLLKKNASIDLISFFILRTHHNTNDVPLDEIALIPFPSHELFTKALSTFDLVIFQNFNYGPYLSRYYLNNIEKFVRQGGAFIMVGGDLSFGSGGYLGTPIEALLPISLGLGQTSASPFRPIITEAGQYHPITRLLAESKANRELWQSFPDIKGANIVGDLRENSIALLEHPHLQTVSGKALPILSVSPYHKGRVMALAIDGSWQWNFEHVGQGGSSSPYNIFWNNAIRWLIRDPELERVQITSFRDSHQWGEPVRFRIRLLDHNYRPQKTGSATLEIKSHSDGKTVFRDTRKLQDDGSIELTWQPQKPDMYRLSVTAQLDPTSNEISTNQALFEVRGLLDEYHNIQPNEGLFAAMRHHTNALTVRTNQSINSLPLKPPTIMRINLSRNVDLWDNLYLLSLMFMLFGSEWFLRRKWGLP